MANMFSGNNEKSIPNNLSECTKTNETVANLHSWSERLEKWGKIFFWAIVIFGVVVTFTETIKTQELREAYRGVMEEYVDLPSELEVFISKLLTWGFYAFLEYCAYHVLALLVSALAAITQNTMISANVALYNANTGKTSANVALYNANTGKTSASKNSNSPVPKGMWACKKCGTHNKDAYGQCKNCGEYRK